MVAIDRLYDRVIPRLTIRPTTPESWSLSSRIYFQFPEYLTYCDQLMPVTFDSFGVKFLYPDNWTQVDRPEEEGKEGVTLELPSGGFFAIERVSTGDLAEDVIEEVADSFAEDYGDIEREEINLGGNADQETAVEFRFYYLDLLIISRLAIVELNGMTLVVQMQAESRDFDENERVFAALLQQLRGPI
ncbi:MAG: hypothetical protein P1U77_09790 [Rubripirellula sp.]|nr:hypothetical protein [Rubripirellula sp.]